MCLSLNELVLVLLSRKAGCQTSCRAVQPGSEVSCMAFNPSSLVKEMTNQYSVLFRQEHTHDDAIWSVAWGSNKKDSETVVIGSLDDQVKVWKWRDEKLDLQWSLEGHQLGVVSVDISHTLPIAASSSLDAHIRLWDLENGKQIKSIDAGPGKSFTLREDIRGLRSLFDIFRERCILVFRSFWIWDWWYGCMNCMFCNTFSGTGTAL